MRAAKIDIADGVVYAFDWLEKEIARQSRAA
jgi:hypothetical protein